MDGLIFLCLFFYRTCLAGCLMRYIRLRWLSESDESTLTYIMIKCNIAPQKHCLCSL